MRPPSNLPIANAVTRAHAEASGGRPLNLLGESVGGLAVTAHVLGGAVMGRDATEGVVDARHEVFGHPGLYVADASPAKDAPPLTARSSESPGVPPFCL